MPLQSGTSLPAQPRDEGACLGKLFFVIRRIWHIATIAHRFKRHIDLAERGLSHGGVPPPLGERLRSTRNQCSENPFVSYRTKMLSQGPVMPSASYYRRQADLLLSFAVTTENPVVSDRCRLLAEEYQSLAAMLGDDQPEVASAVQAVLKRADERGTG
jgi:hypothetical protein